jgi:hypothetical protein
MSRNGSGYYYYNGNIRLWTIDGQGTLDASSIYIGFNAGLNNQGSNAIAIGANAGISNQGTSAIAIGYNAGYKDQSNNAIAIGYNAGRTSQHANSIIINATGNDLSSNTTNSLYIAPIRNTNDITQSLYYNPTTKEITYGDISDANLNNYWTLTGNNIYNTNSGNVGIGNLNPTAKLDVSGTMTVRKTLDLCNNIINDVSAVKFHNNTYITSGDFSGNSSPLIKSLIYNNNGTDNVSNPVSIMRMSHFTNDISYNIGTGSSQITISRTPIRFGTVHVNQLDIRFVDISKTQFIFPNELSGQFIEVYVIQKTNIPTNNASVTVDISSINNTYNENLDTRYYDRDAIITSTFGPHMIRADELHVGKIYSFFTYCIASGGGTAQLLRSEVIMKSYYV